MLLFQNLPSLLKDDRFKVMFENPDFQVDEQSEEFRLLNPLVSKISEKRKRKLKILEELEAREQVKYFAFVLRKICRFFLLCFKHSDFSP